MTDLAPTLSTEEAAALFGCSSKTLYTLVKRGEAPIEPLHMGRTMRWPRALVLRALGLDPQREAAPGATPEAHSNIGTPLPAKEGSP